MPKRKFEEEEGQDIDHIQSQITCSVSQDISQAVDQCQSHQEKQQGNAQPVQNGTDHDPIDDLEDESQPNTVDNVDIQEDNDTAETNTDVNTVLSSSSTSVPEDTVAAKSNDLAVVNETEQGNDNTLCEKEEQGKTCSEIEEVIQTEELQQQQDQPTSSISNQTETPCTVEAADNQNQSQQPYTVVQHSEADLSPLRKRKRRVHFDGVTVYYFHRKQGFTCVPSMGGSTLGMDEQHAGIEEFSVAEYGRLQKAQHCEILLEQHQQGKIYLPPSKLQSVRSLMSNLEASASSTCSSSEEDSVQPPITKRRRLNETEDEEEEEEEEEEVVVDEYYFLQPITTRQRRIMLRQAGIKKIDTSEKEDCKEIRGSREVCGCDCKVYCDPATCICAQADIQCQVDRMSFPCGCTKDGCANPKGRVEFNPIRVRTHFIHTLMRLETEKKCEEIKSKRKEGRHTRFDDCEENDGIAKITDCPNEDLTGEFVEDGDVEEMVAATSADNDSSEHYNSNERGSCCDCQNSEVNEFLMRESQFASNSAMVTGDMDIATAAQYNSSGGASDVEEVLTTGVHEEAAILYNDEEDYSEATANGAAAAALYHQFMKEESCSESSDCSSEGSTAEQENTTTAPAPSASYTGYQQYDVGQPTASDQTYNIPDANSPPQNCVEGATYTASSPPSSTAAAASPTYKLEPISQILNPIGVSGPLPSWCSPSPTAASSYCEYNGRDDSTPHTSQYQPASDPPFHQQPQEMHVDEQENLLDLDKHAEIVAATVGPAPSASTSSCLLSHTTTSSVIKSSVTETSIIDTAVTEPVVTEPSITETSATEPSVTEPSITETSVTEPSATEPLVTETSEASCLLLDLDSQSLGTSSASPPCPEPVSTSAIATSTDSAAHARTVDSMCNGRSIEVPVGDGGGGGGVAQKKEATKENTKAAKADTKDAGTDSEDSGLGTEDQTQQSQNFGEIIKESIVESVTA